MARQSDQMQLSMKLRRITFEGCGGNEGMKGLAETAPEGLSTASDGPTGADDFHAASRGLRMQRGPLARALLRALRRVLLLGGAIIIVAGMALGGLYWRISSGPIGVAWLGPRIAEELNQRYGAGYQFVLGATSLENGENGPSLAVAGFTLRNADGTILVDAPKAEISVAPAPLLAGIVQPTRLELVGVEFRLQQTDAGALVFSAGAQPLEIMPPPLTTADGAGPPKVSAEAIMGKLVTSLNKFADFAVDPASRIASLRRVGVKRGTLVIERQAGTAATRFEDVDLGFDKTGDAAAFTLAASGPKGRWRARSSVTGRAGETRIIDAEISDLSQDELALFADASSFDFDNPVSARVHVELGETGGLFSLDGGFAVGAGAIRWGDSGASFFVDEISGKLRWDPARQALAVSSLQLQSGDARLTANGMISPPPVPGEAWLVELASEPGATAPSPNAGDKPTQIDVANLLANVTPGERRAVIDRVEIKGPQVNVAAKGELWWADGEQRLLATATAGNMTSEAVLRIWPAFASPTVRKYLTERVRNGVLQSGSLFIDLDRDAMASITTDAPLSDERLKLDFAISNATYAFLPGAPPVTGLDANGSVTGRTATLNATRGVIEVSPGKRLSLADAVFNVADTARKPAPATAVLHLTGSLDAVADILSRDAFKNYGGVQIDPTVMKGQVDAHVSLDMKLAKVARASDTTVKVAATLNNFALEKLVGKERFDSATLSLTVDGNGLHASGQGKLLGTVANIDLKKPLNGSADATVQLVLDDAARTRLGVPAGTGVSGPVSARVSAPFGKDGAAAHVELDLTRAVIDASLPGLSKPAGKAAHATFDLQSKDNAVTLDKLAYDASGGASARGALEFDANSGLRAARLTNVRLSPGDDMKIDIEPSREAIKVSVRAANLDARPYLRNILSSDTVSAASDGRTVRDLDLDLKATLLTGYNRQALSAVDLHTTRRGGAIRSISMQARSGRANVNGTAARSEDGGLNVAIETGDGGGLMSFLDLYRRMEGGQFELNGRMNGSRFAGTIGVSNFVLRDEPALRRIISEGAQAREDRPKSLKIDTSAPAFQRLSATFTRQNGVYNIPDGVLYGQEIGLKLDGSFDTPNDRINMTGVFVPAFGLNNLFSKVPLFGPLLTGGTDEGLFAINFRIAGSASAPVLTVNPLSAIAPGFLRKIFGAIDGTGRPPPEAPARPPPEATATSPTSRRMPMSIKPGAE